MITSMRTRKLLFRINAREKLTWKILSRKTNRKSFSLLLCLPSLLLNRNSLTRRKVGLISSWKYSYNILLVNGRKDENFVLFVGWILRRSCEFREWEGGSIYSRVYRVSLSNWDFFVGNGFVVLWDNWKPIISVNVVLRTSFLR